MSMNQIFAEYYNTLGNDKTASAEPTQEDLVKQAQYELFAKVAFANNIDLSKLSDAQCDELFERTMNSEKTAGEMPPQFAKAKKDGDEDEDDESKKKEMAEKEHAEKKAAAAMFQQADSFGRQAAHAYVDELKKVAAAVEQQKEAAPALPPKGGMKGVGDRIREAVSAHGGKAVSGVGGAAAGYVAGRMHKDKEKGASAIDELAANRALAIVDEFNKQAGAGAFNLEEASERIAAVVFTLGLADSTKIASAANVDTAIEIRALEALEAAGYPVQWPT